MMACDHVLGTEKIEKKERNRFVLCSVCGEYIKLKESVKDGKEMEKQ